MWLVEGSGTGGGLTVLTVQCSTKQQQQYRGASPCFALLVLDMGLLRVVSLAAAAIHDLSWYAEQV